MFGSNNTFDSWIVAVDTAIELAQVEAKKRLMERFLELTEEICDELLKDYQEINAQ